MRSKGARPDLISIFPRRQSCLLLEEHAQIFGVLDPEPRAYLRERHVRLPKEFPDGVGPDAHDLLVRRAIQGPPEPGFEDAPGKGTMLRTSSTPIFWWAFCRIKPTALAT